ncbi:MAG: 23S rRNA (guanosine(2251)-2'-O)-methyltransferase RlmB [Endomicrobiaceae bacterium]|nr:23S rRNA (guanosine(2251)-2'-O)-methyltransferase RlmB [Endomicrobiaceae bacterium]
MDKIFGRNAVLEAIRSGNRTINKIFVSKTAHGSSISEIIKLAKMKGIVVNNVPPERLDKFEQENTQGVVAEVSSINYVELEDLINIAKNKEKGLLLLLDSIEDPHNLGAIIRNAVCFGVDGVIIPKWRSATVNETVERTSAGAVEHIKIARVTNSSQAILKLKDSGFWILGAENGNNSITNTKVPFPAVLVMGSEGFGIHQKIKEKCDFIITIPQKNTISSLNVSCATAVILYEISKQ